jgi:RNA polymerase sigma-70 factor (ECF subfamily)
MTETEAAIVRGAMAGDPDAFRSLVDQYHRIVLGMVYRLLSPRTPQDAEDFAQDIFVKLSRTIRSFDFTKQTKFSTWFYTFVRNHCFDLMRKRRLRTVSLTPRRDDDRRGSVEIASAQLSPADESQDCEIRSLITSALVHLPESERVVFVMRELEGRDYRDIASELEIAEGTAKARLYRAKETLRTRLSPYLRDGSLGGFIPADSSTSPQVDPRIG